MIVFNGFHLIGIAFMVVLFVICVIILVIERIVYAINKHKQKLTQRGDNNG